MGVFGRVLPKIPIMLEFEVNLSDKKNLPMVVRVGWGERKLQSASRMNHINTSRKLIKLWRLIEKRKKKREEKMWQDLQLLVIRRY